jgi:hypothetical protein
VPVLSPPPEREDLELLIREARSRQRRRRTTGVASVLAAAALTLGTYAIVSGTGRPAPSRPSASLPPASSPRCRAGQLRLSAGRGGVAGGTYGRPFTFVNVSDQSCTLRGWPTIRLALRDGHRLAPGVRHFHYFSTGIPSRRLPARTIALRPGGAASFIVLAQDASYTPGKPCRLVRTMSVTPPGSDSSLSVPDAIGSYCAALIVPPLVSGSDPPYP